MSSKERTPHRSGLRVGETAPPLTDIEQFVTAAAPLWPAYVAMAALCLMLAWSHLPDLWLVCWTVVYLGYICVRNLVFRHYLRTERSERLAHEGTWRRRCTVVMIAYGTLQSALIAPAIQVVPGSNAMLLTVMVFFSCTLASALAPLSWLSLRLYLAITLLPTVVSWALLDPTRAWFLSIMLLVAALLLMKFDRERLADVRQRDDLARQLAESAELLRRSNVSRTRMIMEASHDLRQPAHALSMMAERLRFARPGPELQARIRDMEQCIASLTDMLGELMEFSQLDLGEYLPRAEVVDLQALLSNLDARFGPVAVRKSLQWSVNCSPVHAVADPWLLGRVLDNVVSNAIRYTPSGSVHVECGQQGGDVVLRVQDTGPGIAPDEQQRVFVEYVRLPHSAGDEPGRGIGLAFVKRATQAMGCGLDLCSRPGQGTTVTVTLGTAQPVTATVSTSQPPTVAAASLADCHLVVIENDELLRRSMQDVLTGWGASVDAVSDVAATELLQVRPSLILADLHLDGNGNGLDAVARLRDRHAGVWIPAILVTGDTAQEVFEQARRQGVEVAYKPLRPSRLRQMIDEALNSARAPDTRA